MRRPGLVVVAVAFIAALGVTLWLLREMRLAAATTGAVAVPLDAPGAPTAVAALAPAGAADHLPAEAMTEGEITARVEECLTMVGLKGTDKLKPAELSGGMKRRVGFARAIALKPKILLFDEPTTGLDPVMTDVIGRIILDLKHELGVTSITITHDLKSAFEIGDRVALLFRGECIACEPPEAFKVNPHPVIQQFLRGDADGPFLQDPPPPKRKPQEAHS